MSQLRLNPISVRLAFQVGCVVTLLASLVCHAAVAADSLILERDQIVLFLPSSEPDSVKIAAKSLARDFKTVMGAEPAIVDQLPRAGGKIVLAIVNDASSQPQTTATPNRQLPALDGFESHRVFVDAPRRTIYLHGNDPRGTIYAIYTFSEKWLGVPPLWYFCSWKPVKKEQVVVSADTNLFFKSPQVRYRAWFPNDTDMFSPWRKLSEDNDTQWLETMLRLKLNTVECSTTVHYPKGMTKSAEQLARYGLVITSHHMIALNSSFTQWETYWNTVRKQPAPALSLANEKEIIAFYRHNIETVKASGMENLWQIALRGDGDKPFWVTLTDAPENEAERVDVINRHLRIQLDLIKEITGEKAPYVRMTFYDELSDFLAKGLLKPPLEPNMIWTFCSARRDHYPNDDLVNFSPRQDVKLGYYMNLQFSSTGSHLAPAEGPWKMEANYRYVNGKAPLYFSVLNAGNLREHLLGLSAGASLLWDFDAYQTDRFVHEYCRMYFGEQHAAEIAALYKDFFAAYWQPTKSTFPGMDRQFLFQDQRYARAIRMIGQTFFTFTPEPLRDIGYERMPGRTFRISPKDNQADNTVDAILHGMKETIPRFASVAERCDQMEKKLPAEYRLFFYDNLGGYAHFMTHLSRSLYHYVDAYKNQSNPAERIKTLESSLKEMQAARESLLRSQHDIFKTWYDGDASANGKFNMPATIQGIEKTLMLQRQRKD